ncbi:class I adenylate-forming enzyme family protein [Klenkia brasiliensis]|uniref:Long-chain acyl-CoA synthetase n=1 Tax=Klenkia brasiliensis TaxID=333142 RepID=A0A1G7S7V6_9ACTN|nr:class I adenylate-forming enzyme family protein [Klenkia brasiliensis]SDG19024.1 long-chain acyl-CoA synthetase [Klenkia brasiliensis]
MNTATLLNQVARRVPHRIAVRHGSTELTHDELDVAAARFAGGLQAEGIQAGDRVGILMHNQVEWLVALLGIWRVGAVAVPYNYLFHPEALRHTTLDAGVRLVVCPVLDATRLEDAMGPDLPTPTVVAVGVTGSTGHGVRSWREVLDRSSPVQRPVPRLDHDDAVLMYTSGSTGRPKGVRQTHRNTAAAAEAAVDAWSLTEDDHALVCTPLFQVGGLQLITLPTLLAGGAVTLRRWAVGDYLDDARDLRPTFTALVPAMLADILAHLRGRPFPLPALRVCAIGGSALPQQRLRQLTELTGVVPVNIYGQTEQSGVSVTEPLDEHRREGSLGRPLHQVVQTRVVVPDSEPALTAAHGQVGELWVRGDTVTPGYWQLEAANREKFVDGWFRTSDLVSTAEDGFLYYVDRTDDMIISGGENVFPQMVEGFLVVCPLVAEVAVIGTPHDRLSSQVTAIVVPVHPATTAEDIAAWCADDPNLRGLQRPRRIEVVDSIPRTATNKVDRPWLKRLYSTAD